MLDVSRDRVPTLDTLFELVDLLAALRMNEFQLYTEHSFAYAEHETVWRNASPLTADEIRRLDAYCRERNVELVANQNCFGHMERWLRHEPYRALAERPDAERPACLYPDDAAFELVAGLFDELLPCFTTSTVNIDCDETFELGRGRSADAIAARGRGRVYLDFVLRVIGHLHGQGKRVHSGATWCASTRNSSATCPRTISRCSPGATRRRSTPRRCPNACAESWPTWASSTNGCRDSGRTSSPSADGTSTCARAPRAGTRWSAAGRTRATTC